MARIPAVEHSFAACPLPPSPDPSATAAGAVDADVAGAVLRTARAVLAERVAQASEIDASFAGDLAGRVADFTLDGGSGCAPASCGGGCGPAVRRTPGPRRPRCAWGSRLSSSRPAR